MLTCKQADLAGPGVEEVGWLEGRGAVAGSGGSSPVGHVAKGNCDVLGMRAGKRGECREEAGSSDNQDELVELCLLRGLHSLTDAELPLQTSDFYSKHMLPAKPPGDLRRASVPSLPPCLCDRAPCPVPDGSPQHWASVSARGWDVRGNVPRGVNAVTVLDEIS